MKTENIKIKSFKIIMKPVILVWMHYVYILIFLNKIILVIFLF